MWDLNVYCTVIYKATMLHLIQSLQNRTVDQLHQASTFIKTGNIAVNEIG